MSLDHAQSHRLGQRHAPASTGILYVATEADRPENAFEGQLVHVTGTSQVWIWANDAWVLMSGGGATSATMFHQDDFPTNISGQTKYYLTYLPLQHSEHVYWNGAYLPSSYWTRTGNAISLVGINPANTDLLSVEYAYSDPTMQPNGILGEIPLRDVIELSFSGAPSGTITGDPATVWMDGSDATYTAMGGTYNTSNPDFMGRMQASAPALTSLPVYNARYGMYLRMRGRIGDTSQPFRWPSTGFGASSSGAKDGYSDSGGAMPQTITTVMVPINPAGSRETLYNLFRSGSVFGPAFGSESVASGLPNGDPGYSLSAWFYLYEMTVVIADY